jgi:orotate phosphoribosyltransferase-like protein
MALTYTIKTFEVDSNESTKTRVGFTIIDDTDDSVFLIDRLVTTGSKTDNTITQEAHTAAQAEVTAWVSSKTNIGKTWNPDTNQME